MRDEVAGGSWVSVGGRVASPPLQRGHDSSRPAGAATQQLQGRAKGVTTGGDGTSQSNFTSSLA